MAVGAIFSVVTRTYCFLGLLLLWLLRDARTVDAWARPHGWARRVVVVHGHRPDPRGEMVDRECLARVARAERVLGAAWVILSGAGAGGAAPSEAEQMEAVWAAGRDRLVLENRSRSTRENARLAGAIARGLGASDVRVVTSWWHCPRAWLAWRETGVPVKLVAAWRGTSVRYVPGELVALARLVLGRGGRADA